MHREHIKASTASAQEVKVCYTTNVGHILWRHLKPSDTKKEGARMIGMSELTQAIGFHHQTVRKWIRDEPRFPYYKGVKVYGFKLSEVEHWLTSKSKNQGWLDDVKQTEARSRLQEH